MSLGPYENAVIWQSKEKCEEGKLLQICVYNPKCWDPFSPRMSRCGATLFKLTVVEVVAMFPH